jgi:hypothetical protein
VSKCITPNHRHVLENEAEKVFGLEGILQLGEKGVPALGEHSVFRHCVGKLILLEHH